MAFPGDRPAGRLVNNCSDCRLIYLRRCRVSKVCGRLAQSLAVRWETWSIDHVGRAGFLETRWPGFNLADTLSILVFSWSYWAFPARPETTASRINKAKIRGPEIMLADAQTYSQLPRSSSLKSAASDFFPLALGTWIGPLLHDQTTAFGHFQQSKNPRGHLQVRPDALQQHLCA